MANYFAVHRHTNLIEKVISSSSQPSDNEEYKFFPIPGEYLNLYYARLEQASGRQVDIYSTLPKPKIPDSLPLSKQDRIELVEYVRDNCNRLTVDHMAHNWRVSPRTISRILQEEI